MDDFAFPNLTLRWWLLSGVTWRTRSLSLWGAGANRSVTHPCRTAVTSVILGKDAPRPLLRVDCGMHFRAQEWKEGDTRDISSP